jgi:hypothetical protein
MSVSSILAFVLAGAAARAKNPTESRSEARELAKLKARIAELEDAIGAANAQARRDQELIDSWRARALAPPAGFGAPVPQFALQRAAAAAQAQAQQAQQAQAYQALAYSQQQNALAQQAQAQPYQHGLANSLGAQSLIDAELWCNCVPSRSQVWAAHGPE